MIINLEEDKREALSSQGFTLIELLAVIVILGVLMIIAIPQVTKYINNSRKDAFADSALAYINSARYSLLNDEYDVIVPDKGNSVCIPLSKVGIEKETKSSYNGTWDTGKSYVKATHNSDGKVTYSIYLVDSTKHGTDGEVTEVALADTNQKRSLIQQNGTEKTCECSSGDGSACTVTTKYE